MGHSGYQMDKRIAREIEDVDLVIGGYSNTLLWNGLPPKEEIIKGAYPTIIEQESGKKVPVLRTYGLTKYMGRFYLKLNSNNSITSFYGEPLFLNDTITQDPIILGLLTYYRELKDLKYDEEVIGHSIVSLSSGNVRVRESNFANLITDSLIYVNAEL